MLLLLLPFSLFQLPFVIVPLIVVAVSVAPVLLDAPVAAVPCLLCHVAGRLSLCSDDLLNCVAGIACVCVWDASALLKT